MSWLKWNAVTFYVMPVVFETIDGASLAREATDDETPDKWGVYYFDPEGLSWFIDDHTTREDALVFAADRAQRQFQKKVLPERPAHGRRVYYRS